ncbi:EamA family transporter [Candidatus Cyrtobacter comes]|uniref:S-adenosylmethionine uptake transporter n=1 Tax=Candidatus Cyrtobacter comes TaxID=675776 RepID=A0ABU5L6Z0_9RICK|nr:DMT family transporter [Candidatus Cyrtobacter comes]MDZ5761899.1 EamA family transporter [Candidatus Cyrtobacter comes]
MTSGASHKSRKEMMAILFMVINTIAISAVYVSTKFLTASLHPNQVAFLYKFSCLLVVVPWCIATGFRQSIKTFRMGLHVTRGVFSFMGAVCFAYSISKIKLTDASAIAYLENVIVLCVGVFYFKEKLNTAKVILISFGFVGAVFVTNPSLDGFVTDYVFMFLALIFWAINNLTIKVLGKTEGTKAQLFYGTLFGSLFSMPMAIHEWRPIELYHLKYIIALALFHGIHSIAFFKAFKFSDVSSVMPFDYLRLVFTGLFGYLFFYEIPQTSSIFGYILIVSGGMYFIHHEGKKNGLYKKKSFSEK